MQTFSYNEIRNTYTYNWALTRLKHRSTSALLTTQSKVHNTDQETAKSYLCGWQGLQDEKSLKHLRKKWEKACSFPETSSFITRARETQSICKEKRHVYTDTEVTNRYLVKADFSCSSYKPLWPLITWIKASLSVWLMKSLLNLSNHVNYTIRDVWYIYISHHIGLGQWKFIFTVIVIGLIR